VASTTLTDNSTLSLSFSGDRDPTNITVLMRPKVEPRTSSATNISALLGLGQVIPGTYEIELEEAGSRCTLRSSVDVSCSGGYIPAGGVAGKCIPISQICRDDEWLYGTSCLRRPEMAVQASTNVVQIILMKSRSNTIATAKAELRLKSGDVNDQEGHQIAWTAALASNADWLALDKLSSSVHSRDPVAEIVVTASASARSDTAQSHPLFASIVFSSKAIGPGMTSDFVNGTNKLTIDVTLAIKAVPYVTDSDVAITGSSGEPTAVGVDKPVTAGDRLTIAVKALDADRLPICRPDLALSVIVRGKLNGAHRAPL
jgi:hypothetical protein